MSERGSGFSTTRWSVILSAGGSEDPNRQDALAQMCQEYWRPVYVFIRRTGKSPEQATDLTQEYFTRLIEREYLSTVKPGIGKFRSFLLTSVKNFLANAYRDSQAKKRGGDVNHVSIDGDDAERIFQLHNESELSPEEAYELQWARTLLQRARHSLRNELESLGKLELFRATEGHLGGEGVPLSFEQISERLGVSYDAAKMTVTRIRKRFGRVLRDEIAQTVEPGDDVDAEVRQLLARLR